MFFQYKNIVQIKSSYSNSKIWIRSIKKKILKDIMLGIVKKSKKISKSKSLCDNCKLQIKKVNIYKRIQCWI